ncbi:MAG: hypothetical protein V4670_07520 [Bacteroidota bacterium]
MKNFLRNSICSILVFITTASIAQVGIGTTTPKAALDVEGGANNYGFLMPRIALTASNVAAPVKNPVTGTSVLEVGTMVFNTATTAGTYGVIPGIYFWDGTNWVSQVHRYFDKKFTQNANFSVATTASTYSNIPGLNSKTFIAPYTGKYSVTFTGYLGAGKIDDRDSKMGFVEGIFKFTVNGTDYKKYSHSTSFWNSDTSFNYWELFNETNIMVTISLNAGDTCSLNASYNGANENNMLDTNAHVVGTLDALGNQSEINVFYIGR